MARNIEVKARIPGEEFETVRRRAAALSLEPPEAFSQTDTFFGVPRGRLKLREFADGSAELIFYERPDRSGPKPSSYIRSASPSPSSLRQALTAALGVRGVVKKRREVFLVGQTRIHLDEVENLGLFLELEVVLWEGQSDSQGEAIAAQLIAEFGLGAEQLVPMAYIDLLARQRPRDRAP